MILVLPSIPIMKPRLLLPTIALLAMASAAVQAATVSISVSTAGAVPKFVDSLGGFLTAGDAVRVGIFNVSTPANLATLQTSNVFAEVNALFTPLAENITNAGTVNETGATGTNMVINNMFGTGNIFGQIQNIDSTYCTPGTELFIWAFNNADPNLATQWGIFTSTGGWEFPAALGSSTLSTSASENVVIIRGDSLGGNLALSNINIVPEPGSWLMLIVGAVVLTGRRRRSGLQL